MLQTSKVIKVFWLGHTDCLKKKIPFLDFECIPCVVISCHLILYVSHELLFHVLLPFCVTHFV